MFTLETVTTQNVGSVKDDRTLVTRQAMYV